MLITSEGFCLCSFRAHEYWSNFFSIASFSFIQRGLTDTQKLPRCTSREIRSWISWQSRWQTAAALVQPSNPGWTQSLSNGIHHILREHNAAGAGPPHLNGWQNETPEMDGFLQSGRTSVDCLICLVPFGSI